MESKKEYAKRYSLENKERFRERSRARYLKYGKTKDLEKWRDGYYQNLYGITLAEYNQILEAQGHVCAICRQPCTRRLAVDHCHSTGRVRGLLCVKCNRGLGNFDDDVTRLKAAANYMENDYASYDSQR